jgi:putative hemolysin
MEGCKCFQVVQTTATSKDAETNCVKRGGSLASVTTQEIQDRLFCLEQTSDFWIGLNDAATEGVYVWPNGESFGSYTNWLTVPHVSSASLQSVKAKGGSGKWEILSGTQTLKYACEIRLDLRDKHLGLWISSSFS